MISVFDHCLLIRNVSTLTKEAGRTKRKLVDCCIQTENYHTNSYNDINKELTEWNDRSASVDYIDRAIEKVSSVLFFLFNPILINEIIYFFENVYYMFESSCVGELCPQLNCYSHLSTC